MRDLKYSGMVLAMGLFWGSVHGTAYAQDKIEGTVGADVVSHYVWRGQSLGDAAIQPTAGLTYKGLSLTGWASISFIDPNKYDKEYDLTLSYTTGGFNVGITDYFFSHPSGENQYLEYRADRTQHVWEANVGYDFGPLALQWYTNIGGADGVNKKGERAYSSYFTIAVPFQLASCEWQATLGVVPYATSFYSCADGFAVTAATLRATHEVAITPDWNLPLFIEGTLNPSCKKAYLTVGASFSL